MNIPIQPQAVIGIDPDVEASGFASIIVTDGYLTADYTTLDLPALIATIDSLWRIVPVGQPFRVFIEAGWLNRGNWHLNPHDSRQAAAAKGRQAGRNHQLGLDICALLKAREIPYAPVAPLRKCWAGRDRKVSHDELHRIIARVNGSGMPRRRSNQEERDALLLAWIHAGLPVRI